MPNYLVPAATKPLFTFGTTTLGPHLAGTVSAGDQLVEAIGLGTGFSITAGKLEFSGGGGTPGGADKDIQFNDGGAFGGESALTWDKTANLLTIAGTAGSLSIAQASSRIYTKSANDGTATIFQTADVNANTVFGLCPNGTADTCGIRAWASSSPTNGYFGQFSIAASGATGAPFVGFDSSNNNNAGGYPLRVRITPSGSTTHNNVASFYNTSNINFGSSTSDPGIAFNVQGYSKHDLSMGIGTTPATTYNGVIALEVGQSGCVIGNTAAGALYLTNNARYLTTTNWTYKTTAAAILWSLSGRDIYLQHAASGTAGTAITLGFGMCFFGATGNFNVGTAGAETAGAERFQIGGSLSISSAVMIRTYTAFTNGAGANAGTLTNAPAAGDPTKWIPVNDNGTTRYIPAW